jgi:hypothetical protein
MAKQAITLPVGGTLLREHGRAALLLRTRAPEGDDPDRRSLLFALLTRGPGDHIFPAFLLDDWGNEVRGLKLYDWIDESGERFPRAEVFGFDRDGSETQVFLRHLELYARLPCYTLEHAGAPVEEAVLLEAILLPDAEAQTAHRIEQPADLTRPLSAARVSWWRVPAGQTAFDFWMLDQAPPDPGY